MEFGRFGLTVSGLKRKNVKITIHGSQFTVLLKLGSLKMAAAVRDSVSNTWTLR
jgi:hypothetical protein